MGTRTIDEIEGLDRISNNAKGIILKAYDIARYEQGRGQNTLRPSHLFEAILKSKQGIGYKVLSRLGLRLDEILSDILTSRGAKPRSVVASEEFNELILGAFWEANNLGHVYVGSEHLLLSLFKLEEKGILGSLKKKGVSYEVVKRAIVSMGNYHPGVFSSMPTEAGEQAGALEYFARDMNEMAKQGKFLPIFGRNDEIDRLIHILSRKNKNNPVIIGEPGVGKTAIVEGFVQRVIAGGVPDSLTDAKVIQLDLAVILAGAKIRGDVEERLLAVIDELREDRNKIVFIDEIHMIVGAGTSGGGGGMDIANLLKPHLTSGDIKVIGATTHDEYQKYFEEDNALSRRFQSIQIEEISTTDAINLMKYVKEEYEKFHGLKISQNALEESVKLSGRYIVDRYLPDKALDVLDETAAKKRLSQRGAFQKSMLVKKLEEIRVKKLDAFRDGEFELASVLRHEELSIQQKIRNEKDKLVRTRKRLVIDGEDIRETISKITGIPVQTLSKTDKQNLKLLQKKMSKQIIGQEKALKNLSKSLKRARVGLIDENRPLGSFLFLGPTGVGKTETAKIMAEHLFGDQSALIQVNMSEYMEQHSVSKIIGSPPGYVGYQEGGQLTEKVRRKPYSVVLFDEMEKAHPDMLNILLQILEEGEISDSKGRVVNFRNTIIIMTSNIGAEDIAHDSVLGFDLSELVEEGESVGDDVDDAYKKMEEKLMIELKGEMRPEFLNRIDDIVIFRGLDQGDAGHIVKLLLGELNQRLAEFNMRIDYTPAVVKKLVEEGFSAEYGARNLRRAIQDTIEVGLSELILEERVDISKGAKVKVGVKEGEFFFEVN